jgi:DNA gyrase inhibitor GyrI
MRFTPPEQCRYDCCIAIGETLADTAADGAWPELSPVALKAGLCASIRYRGYYAASDAPDEGQSISHAYSHLLDTWLTHSRYTFAGDYAAEIYAVPPSRCAPQELECTIMVQVR